MAGFSAQEGGRVVLALTATIQDNKQYLSDIDGLIGDGDHGINMNKGFTLAAEAIGQEPADLAAALKTLSQTLMTKIGGSMGPLYGMLFRAMAKACDGKETIDADTFAAMLSAALEGVQTVSQARRGDKTLMDVLIPAQEAFVNAHADGNSFSACLDAMTIAAEQGRDATREMASRVGRSSRLGERSRGVIDAGAASCCLILTAMANTMKPLLDKTNECT